MATGTPTPNMGLTQWLLDDRIKMNEFNVDHQKIDGAIGALQTEVANMASLADLDSKADAEALDELTKRVEALEKNGGGTTPGGPLPTQSRITVAPGNASATVFIENLGGAAYAGTKLVWKEGPAMPENQTDGTVLDAGMQTEQALNGLSNDQTYTVRAFAYNQFGQAQESTEGAVASFMPIAATVMGYEWDFGKPSPVLTRLGAAEGLTVAASVGTVTGHSDFDTMPIYKDIRRCNLAANGTVTAYEGEPGFSFTPASGDVMVEIPAFYYKIENDAVNKKYRSYIADNPLDGFELHPAFNRPSGPVSRCYIGAYETIAGHVSRSGAKPLGNQTRAQFRASVKAKGAGWSQQDLAVRMAVAELIKIEFANNDVQAVIGAGNTATSAALATGGTNSVKGSGRAAGTATAMSVVWRGVENLWGDVFEWVDGFNFNNGVFYVCTDQSKFADDTATGYTKLSYSVHTSSSFLFGTALGNDPANPWAAMPTAFSGGSETTYLCDIGRSSAASDLPATSGWSVVLVGGAYSEGGQSGLSYWMWCRGSGAPSPHIGGRLLYYPQA